ncbi:MAG: Gldg family protein [Rhodospirillaceae bacterium]
MPSAPGVASAVWAVCRHELRLLLYTPLSYLFQIGFLAALIAAIFLIGDFYATDEASLRLMTVFLPWVALVLVPALAMRSWPDPHTDRSVELTMTLPMPPVAVVAGKFLAGYAVLLITLAFTLPMAATVAYLGDPDMGVMVAAYAAAALLLAVYYALSLFAASLAREPIGAFVLSLAMLFFLLLLGWDVFGRILKQSVPFGVIDLLALYSPYPWMTRMSQGVIDTGAAVYFLAVIAFALFATTSTVAAGRRGRGRVGRVLAGLAALVILIPVAARAPGALDLTQSKEFTLHAGTRQILKKLPEGTRATLYWSASEASVPANIKAHARRVRSILNNMAAASGGRLAVHEVDPRPDTDEELSALAAGARRIPMSSGDSFLFGLTVTDGKRAGNIPYMDIRRDQLTEYDVAFALNGLTRLQTPKIALLSPLVPSQVALADVRREGMTFIAELKRAFDIAVIPFFKPELPEGLNILVVVDAAVLRAEMLYEIDQFVMRGGRLIVMIDPYVRAHPASNMVNPAPSQDINDMSDLLARWGLRYENAHVVGDSAAASVVADAAQRSMSYPFWMRLRGESLAAGHPATASLNEVFFVESGSFKITDAARVQPLITTGQGSGTLPRDVFKSRPPAALAADFKSDGKSRVLAAVIAGPMQSAFAAPPPGHAGAGHTARSGGDAAVYAVADVDWLFDPFSLQTTQIDGQVITRPLNDNLAFLQNLIEFAAGERSLIAIRSRGAVARPFTRVEAMFKDAQEKFRREETELSARVAEVERLLSEIPASAGVRSIDQLPPALKAEIDKQRKDLLPLRRELRSIRRSIREGIDVLGRRLVVANIAAGPVLVFILWMGVAIHRRRRTPPGTQT